MASSDSDVDAGGKLKQTVKLIKFWRECRVPKISLNMFYVEMVVAQEGICQQDMSLGICFNNTLAHLANIECRFLEDPLEVSGEIAAANSDAKIKKTQRSVQTFADKAYKAIEAENEGDDEEALRLWSLVFNGYFPMTK